MNTNFSLTAKNLDGVG